PVDLEVPRAGERMTPARSLADLPEPHVRLLEQLCDGFERSWQEALRRGGVRPRLEDLLAELPAEVRNLGRVELLRVEWGQRRQHGERPNPEEYVGRFPALGSALAELLASSDGRTQSPEPDLALQAAAEPEAIPGYRLMRRLGGGGLGEVFLA